MSRTKARESALQIMFGLDFNAEEKDAIILTVFEDNELTKNERKYAKILAEGATENLAEIDRRIKNVSRSWQIGRMGAADRNIVRLAAYEMFFADEKITPAIVINEAVELAKKYGADESGQFVNGILGAMTRMANESAEKTTG